MAFTARSRCYRALCHKLAPATTRHRSSSSSFVPVLLHHGVTHSSSFTRVFSRSLCAGESVPRVISITTDTEYHNALSLAQEKGAVAVVYFTAKWCAPCKVMSPIIDELSAKYPLASFVKVDIDMEGLKQVVSDAQLTSVPTFKFYHAGKPSGYLLGANHTELRARVAALSKKTNPS